MNQPKHDVARDPDGQVFGGHALARLSAQQQLDDNPFRSESRPYLEVGMLGEIVLGSVSLFLNLENILDVRQTKSDRIVLPMRGSAGEWTVDAWAPTGGSVVNGGLRWRL
jgi:iron complex outermembrane receptor protein